MAKIKCAHCGATNQDVTENDPCWQCGEKIGAAVAVATASEAAPAEVRSTATLDAAPISPLEPMSPPITPPTPATRPAEREPAKQEPVQIPLPESSSPSLAMIAGGITVILIIILLVMWKVLQH